MMTTKNYSLYRQIAAEDDRQILWKSQRKERGFDATELWNLDRTIAKFVYPRIVEFKNAKQGCPAGLTEKKWNKKLNSMIACFEILVSDDFILNEEQTKIVNKGFKNFTRYYFNLWI